MSRQKYYLTENDYSYLIRVFRKAESLPWHQVEKDDAAPCWSLNIDFENVPDSYKEILGKDYESFLERFKRNARSEPPSASEFSPLPSSPPPAGLVMGRTKKKKNKRTGFRFLLVMLLLCASAAAGIKYYPDYLKRRQTETALPAPEKEADFMKLLRGTLNTSSEIQTAPPPQISKLLSECQEHLRANRLTTGGKGTALECYREVLRQAPDNLEAKAGLEKIEMKYVLWVKKSLRANQLDKAREYMEGIERVNPDSAALIELKQELAALENPGESGTAEPDSDDENMAEKTEKTSEIPPAAPEPETKTVDPRVAKLLGQCQKHLRAKRLTSGRGGTALECYQQVLKLDPDNIEAQAGLKNIEMQYILWAKNALRRKDLKRVRGHLENLEKVNPASSALTELRQYLSELENKGKAKKMPAETSKADSKPRGNSKKDFTEMSLGAGFNE
jgi:tetratricopeptide (TPR) repeat protein